MGPHFKKPNENTSVLHLMSRCTFSAINPLVCSMKPHIGNTIYRLYCSNDTDATIKNADTERFSKPRKCW